MGCQKSSNVIQNSHKLENRQEKVIIKSKKQQKLNFLIGNVNDDEYLFARVSVTNKSIDRLTIPQNFKPLNHSSMLCLSNNSFFICGGINYSLTQITSDTYIYNHLLHSVEKKSSMNQPRYTQAAIQFNHMVYIFGGRYFGSDQEAILNHCQKFNFQDNLWIDLPKLNIKRCTAYAIEWINHIYVFGGYTGIFQRSQKIEKLNQIQKKWQIIDFCLNRGIQSAFVTSLEPNKVMIFGGNTNLGEVSSVITLDFKHKTIVSNRPLRQQKFLHKSFVFEHNVYIFGGSQSLELEIFNIQDNISQVIDLKLNGQFKLEIFQTLTHSQSSIYVQEQQIQNNMYLSRQEDDVALLFGNIQEPFILEFNSSIPFAQKHHVPFELKLFPFSGGLKLSIDSYILFGGHQEQSTKASKSVYLYNHKQYSVKVLQEMIISRFSFCYLKHYDRIFVIGGCNYDGQGNITNIDDVESYDIKKNQWKKMWNLPIKVKNSSCIVHCKEIYVFGGKINEISCNQKIFKYDEELDKWIELNFKFPNHLQSAVVFQKNSHEYYLFGGNNQKGIDDSIFNLKFIKQKKDQFQLTKIGQISDKKVGYKVFKPKDQQFLVILGGKKDLITYYNIQTLQILKWDGLNHIKNIFLNEIQKINSNQMQKYLFISKLNQY